MEQIKLTLPKNSNEIEIAQTWLLDGAERYSNGDCSRPVDATFKALVNGEIAFREIHHAIEQAEHSVDIAIWGFQPSMFFVRDEHLLNKPPRRIGDILIEKANQGKAIGKNAPLYPLRQFFRVDPQISRLD